MKHKLHDQFEHKFREDAFWKFFIFLKLNFNVAKDFASR